MSIGPELTVAAIQTENSRKRKKGKEKKTWDISGVCFKLHQIQDIARKFALLTDKILQLKGQAVNYYL